MKCKRCHIIFKPTVFLQKFCKTNNECLTAEAMYLLEKKKEVDRKKRAKETKVKKESLMTLSDWIKIAQVTFNTYIRLRDKDQPCISCQRHHKGQYHAGHYRTAAAAPQLRFNEFNVSKQCSACNNYKSGNITEYRINLVKKIGVYEVEKLEQDNSVKKYSIQEIQNITRFYKEKLKTIGN